MKAVLILAALLAPSAASAEAPIITLAKMSQCLLCHSVDHRIIGPAWNDVSARYNAEITSGRISEKAVEDMLVEKVSRGGNGNWNKVTGGMYMPPNYPRVSKENIRKLVEFVLSLKSGA